MAPRGPDYRLRGSSDLSSATASAQAPTLHHGHVILALRLSKSLKRLDSLNGLFAAPPTSRIRHAHHESGRRRSSATSARSCSSSSPSASPSRPSQQLCKLSAVYCMLCLRNPSRDLGPQRGISQTAHGYKGKTGATGSTHCRHSYPVSLAADIRFHCLSCCC